VGKISGKIWSIRREENCAGKWKFVKEQAFRGKINSEKKCFLSYSSRIALEIARGMEKLFSDVENGEVDWGKKIKNWQRNIFKNIVEEKMYQGN